MSFSLAKERFLQYLLSHERSEATITSYSKDVAMFGRFLEGRHGSLPHLESVNAEDIEAYLDWLQKERNYAPASRARHLHTLRSFFSYASRKELISKNVALSVDCIKIQQKERVYLSETVVGQLIEAIEHQLVHLVVQTMYLTGLRISECLGLKLRDVDLQGRLIHVVNGKGKKDRVIPISDRLLPLMRNYVQNNRSGVESDFLFATAKTGRLSPVYVNRLISVAAKGLGWQKEVSAHVLRHSFASQLVKKDVSIVQIQKLLGHSILKVTSIYVHSDLQQLSQAVNAL